MGAQAAGCALCCAVLLPRGPQLQLHNMPLKHGCTWRQAGHPPIPTLAVASGHRVPLNGENLRLLVLLCFDLDSNMERRGLDLSEHAALDAA